MATKKFILSLILALLSIGNALAFDEDGFRTGMTMQEVQALLPKGQKLDNMRIGERSIWSFSVYEEPSKKLKNRYLPMFGFCDGLLVSYDFHFKASRDFFAKMKTLLERYGHPSKIEITDDNNLISQSVSWIMSPERVFAYFSPPDVLKGQKEPGSTGMQWVTFVTENTCGEFDQPLRTPPWRIAPFGTIGMLDTSSAATGTPR